MILLIYMYHGHMIVVHCNSIHFFSLKIMGKVLCYMTNNASVALEVRGSVWPKCSIGIQFFEH